MKKHFKILFIITICFLLTITLNLKASVSHVYVIPGGESIGLKIDTDIEIVGKYTVTTKNGKINPWKNSKVDVGDIITAINNQKISSNTELLNYLNNYNSDEAILSIERNGEQFNTSISVLSTINNERSIGLYVRDKVLGVGTLSFVTEDNHFASLGHGIYDNDELIDREGKLTYSTVAGIKKATTKAAGEKRAILNTIEIGEISRIKNTGVYGIINSQIPKKDLVAIANVNEVKKGKAEVYTVLSGNKVESYTVEIIETKSQSSIDTKGLKIMVKDADLTDISGGIIQGMSGSPIIQDGMLVGVVSHVTIENPTIGYAMYAKWMYDEIYN